MDPYKALINAHERAVVKGLNNNNREILMLRSFRDVRHVRPFRLTPWLRHDLDFRLGRPYPWTRLIRWHRFDRRYHVIPLLQFYRRFRLNPWHPYVRYDLGNLG